VIRKDGIQYYAFYSPEWKGKIELRGLPEGSYKITDYVNGRELGTVNSDNPVMDVEFTRNLLIQASRVQ
jgi:alpha-galactosidase